MKNFTPGRAPVRRLLVALPVVASSLAGPSLAAAQAGGAEREAGEVAGRILGRVLDDATGQPLAGVPVLLLDSASAVARRALSDTAGRFLLEAPRPGGYRLFADMLGYGRVLSQVLPLAGPETLDVELRMVPAPIGLDPIEVTAERQQTRLAERGFYARRDRHHGWFLDADAIREQRARVASDLVRLAPGVHVRWAMAGGAVLTSRRRSKPCLMKVVLDGVAVDQSLGSLDHLVHPEDVIGIEVYPGGIGAPIQHRGTDRFCGIVMVWTR